MWWLGGLWGKGRQGDSLRKGIYGWIGVGDIATSLSLPPVPQ